MMPPPSKEICNTSLNALALFERPDLLTPDELTCLGILREAIEDIRLGGSLPDHQASTAGAGGWKVRQLRRVAVSYFHPASARQPSPPPPAQLQVPVGAET